jgi:Cytochrome c552
MPQEGLAVPGHSGRRVSLVAGGDFDPGVFEAPATFVVLPRAERRRSPPRKGDPVLLGHALRLPTPLAVAGHDPHRGARKACQACHTVPEKELESRVLIIQDRHNELLQGAAAATTDLLDAIVAARKAGAREADVQATQALQRKAQWRLDFVAAENSMGFHAPQEMARILGETIDFARQGQLAAERATRKP